MFTPKEICCRVCGILSGLLLGLPNLFGALAPVQCFALLPVLVCAARWKLSRGVLITAGTYMALGYTLPQVIVLLLPLPIVVILILDYVIVMMVLVLAASSLLSRPTVLRCFVFAALVVVLDWANFTAIPIWGTAQSIVRPWSSCRHLIAFTSVTGMGGILFLLAFVQAAAVCMINAGWINKPMLKAVSVTLAVFAIVNVISLTGKPVNTIKVAAVGWNEAAVERFGDPESGGGFENLLAAPVRSAAAQGAKLVISPEMGFYVDQFNRSVWIEMVTALALANNVHLAVGYADAPRNENRMLLVDNSGRVVDEYTKRYLTPYENFNKGDGQPRFIDIGGVKIGAMICHDDNYTSISRRYGRAKAGLIAVPTLDWKQIRFAHMQNCIHRTIESRYALVRASYEGISAVISARGKVIASYDHVTDGHGMIIADVQVYDQRTVFSILGNWFVLASGIFVAGYIIKSKWLTKPENAV
ncbi:MAG: hypothetical protein FVQ82_11375 [Planctomycetes bacterium]|nr:hypothetical protein [Planctomycetota bacterium]